MAKNNDYLEDENYVPKAFKKSKNKPNVKFKEKNNKKVKKIKQINTKRIILIVLAVIILIMAIWTGITTHRWKTLAKDMMIQENSIVKDIDNNTIAEIRFGKKQKIYKNIRYAQQFKKCLCSN